MQRLLARLPARFRWTLHNMLAHPLSEVAYQLGLHAASRSIHDLTAPRDGEHRSGEEP
jgi:hypothetical protein